MDPTAHGPVQGRSDPAPHLIARAFRASRWLCLALSLSWGGVAAGATPAAAEPLSFLTRGPYLQQATVDSIVIVWRTWGPTKPVVRFGVDPGELTGEAAGEAIILRVSEDVTAPPGVPRLYRQPAAEAAERSTDHDPSTPANTYQYEAYVSGLQPGTTYTYAVYDDDKLLAGGDATHRFTTLPPAGSRADLRLWVVGDSGKGTTEQIRVHEAMRRHVAATGRAIDHYVHVGDMAYGDGTDGEFQRYFFEPYADTLRHTVCWPTLGNHEGHTSRGLAQSGPYFDAYVVPTAAESGGVPSGTEAYYSFDLGDAHFVCLDSHDLDRSPEAAMAQWLRADLEQTRARWLIAFWHHPPYTKGSHDSDHEQQLIEMRENFMPILEGAGVDLTLTGHSHIYERSMLMDGAYATPTVAAGVILDDGDGDPNGDGPYRKSEGLQPHEGSVAVVAGHGGTSLGREGTMPVMRQIILEHGSVILDIQGDTLQGIMLDQHGDIRDTFRIVKQGRVTPTRVANPWQPPRDRAQLTAIVSDFWQVNADQLPMGWRLETGSKDRLHLATSDDKRRRILHVRSGQEALVALYDEAASGPFEYDALLRLPENAPGAGVVFGYVDGRNYHELFLDASAGTLQVVRHEHGQKTLLAERPTTVAPGAWFELGVEGGDETLEVKYEDASGQVPELEFEVPLALPLPHGRVGFQVPPQSRVDLLLFKIEGGGLAP